MSSPIFHLIHKNNLDVRNTEFKALRSTILSQYYDQSEIDANTINYKYYTSPHYSTVSIGFRGCKFMNVLTNKDYPSPLIVFNCSLSMDACSFSDCAGTVSGGMYAYSTFAIIKSCDFNNCKGGYVGACYFQNNLDLKLTYLNVNDCYYDIKLRDQGDLQPPVEEKSESEAESESESNEENTKDENNDENKRIALSDSITVPSDLEASHGMVFENTTFVASFVIVDYKDTTVQEFLDHPLVLVQNIDQGAFVLSQFKANREKPAIEFNNVRLLEVYQVAFMGFKGEAVVHKQAHVAYRYVCTTEGGKIDKGDGIVTFWQNSTSNKCNLEYVTQDVVTPEPTLGKIENIMTGVTAAFFFAFFVIGFLVLIILVFKTVSHLANQEQEIQNPLNEYYSSDYYDES